MTSQVGRDAQASAPSNACEELRRQVTAAPIGQVMDRHFARVSPDASAAQVAELFLEREISSAPVVDGQGRPVGMVTKTDLLRLMGARAAAGTLPVDPSAADAPMVADIAPSEVLCLHEGAPISVAAALMAHRGIHRLPIVAADGTIVGMVNTLDIVRWLARATGMEQAER